MSTYFYIRVHHGGRLVRKPVLTYEEGHTDLTEQYDVDMISMLDLNEIVKSFNYISYTGLWYKSPTDTVDMDLRPLNTNQDLMILVGCVLGFKEVSIFMEHDLNEPTTIPLPLPEPQSRENAEDVGASHVEEMGEQQYIWSDNESNDEDYMADDVIESDFGDCTDDFYVEDNEQDDEADRSLARCAEVVMNWEKTINSDDDDVRSFHDSSDDDSQHRFPIFRKPYDPNQIRFKIGMMFASFEDLKQVITYYAIHEHRNIRFAKNDTKRLRAKCSEGCSWMLYAAKLRDEQSVQIKTYLDAHTCVRTYHNKRMTAKWISQNIVKSVRSEPNIRTSTVQNIVSERWGIGCNISKAGRARRLAKELSEGDYRDQYKHVRDYCAEILRSNPGSTCFVQASVLPETDVGSQGTHPQRFERLYMCLAAMKQGFIAGCRPLIGLDGCHLKGPCGGMLLAAVALDPNNMVFPIAIAVVEGETKQSWKWFLERLQDDVGHVSEKHWTIISDQQKGLLPALADIMPGVNHRFCVRHLCNNFKKVHKGVQLVEIMWTASRATYEQAFEAQMKRMKVLNKNAWAWLAKLEPNQWSKSAFSTFSKCDVVSNNMSESFNSMMLDAREKPIITMLELFRESWMDRYQANREKLGTFNGDICPSIQSKLDNVKKNVGEWITKHAGNEIFSVTGMYKSFIVNLGKRTCSCRLWDLCGIPCVHAITAIYHKRSTPELYVDHCYHKSAYARCYEHIIYPINGQDMWPRTGCNELLPPVSKRGPGRPKKLRRREPDEPTTGNGRLSRKKMKMKCRKCGVYGHNKRTCNAQTSAARTDIANDVRN